jgi:shikimate kinase
MKKNKNIVLTGFMGTGKTETGKMLAGELNMEFIDTDAIIEKRENDRIARIFQIKGEKYFRKLEVQVIREVSGKENCVIATGGGAVINNINFRNLKQKGIIICLTAQPAVILARTTPSADRPLLLASKSAIETIRNLLRKREPYYSMADYTLDTTDLTPLQAANKIIEKLKNYEKKP